MPSKKVDGGNCLTCGVPIQVYPFQLKKGWGKYCSVACGSSSRTRERNAAWKGDSVTYEAAHYRVSAERGPATNYTCDCGNEAHEWAYNHDDPNGTVCPKGRPYSSDPAFYDPKCRSCHRRGDAARKRLERVRDVTLEMMAS